VIIPELREPAGGQSGGVDGIARDDDAHLHRHLETLSVTTHIMTTFPIGYCLPFRIEWGRLLRNRQGVALHLTLLLNSW
jgi:hypothetical protein